MTNDAGHITELFPAISLAELDSVALQSRFECKFLFPDHLLPHVMTQLAPDYRVLEIDGRRSFDYLTWYFDTPDFHLYRDHHNGYTRRMKIRQRRYEQSGDVFFEVKRKASELRTDKSRFRIADLQTGLSPDLIAAIPAERLNGQLPEYKLSNRFCRITLCDHAMTERVTIDTCISADKDGTIFALGAVALMELKQLRPNPQSPAFLLMKKEHIFESGFSKYAVAAAMLYPELKRNNLKPVFLKLQRYAAG